jgi:hypothetical protein
VKVTAETITDSQIWDLLDSGDPTVRALSLTEKAWCLSATRVAYTPAQKRQRAEARSRCAAIWNARHGDDE